MSLLQEGRLINKELWKKSEYYGRFLVKSRSEIYGNEDFFPLWLLKIDNRIFMQLSMGSVGDSDDAVFYYVELNSKSYNDFKLKKTNVHDIVKREEKILRVIVKYDLSSSKLKSDEEFKIIPYQNIIRDIESLGIINSHNNSESYPLFDQKFYYE